MPKSQGSPGKEITVSSDGLVNTEEIVTGKGRVPVKPSLAAPSKRPISANFGEISGLYFTPNPVIRGGTGSATIGFAPGATIGLSAIQYKFSYRQIGSGTSVAGRWTSVPLTANTFNFYPNINAERGALEVRTVFNNTPIFTKSVSVPLTDQPVAPSFSSNPTINDVTAASGDTITVGSFTANGNPPPVVTYQWYLNSSAVSGGTNSSYTTTAVGGVSAEVILTNDVGTVSAIAEGQVGLVPTFNVSPSASATNVSADTAVTIDNVAASGTAPITTTYKWTQNGSIIAGANLQSYTPTITGPLSGNVTITNNFGTNNANVDFGVVGVAPSFYTGDDGDLEFDPSINNEVGDFVRIRGIYFNGVPTPGATATFVDSIGSRTPNIVSNPTSTDGGKMTDYLEIRNTSDITATITLGNIHGATSSSLVLTNISPADAAASFLGTPTASITGATVGTPLSILDAGATGWPVPSTVYQWTQNSSVISGATLVSYTPSATGPLFGKVTINNSSGGATSANVDFGDIAAGLVAPFFGDPQPSQSPASGQLNVGENAQVLSVNAGGNLTPDITYKWTRVPGTGQTLGTNSVYTAVSADEGKVLNVVTTLTNASGATSNSMTFGTVLPALVAPSFTGTPSASATGVTVGNAVTINNVGATGTAPITTTYVWTQSGSTIAGATLQSYTTSATGPLSGNVTITNSVGSTGATLSFGDIVPVASGVAPSFINPPSAIGIDSSVGDTVRIRFSEATGTAPITTTYRWTQDGSIIAGATLVSYTTSATGPLSGNVTITNTVGSTGATLDFGIVSPANAAASFLGTPSASVIGATVGTQVTINDAGATGWPVPSTVYQWTQNSSVISGATLQSYTTSATGPLSGNVTITNSVGSTGATLSFGDIVPVASGNFAPSFTSPPAGSTTNPDVGERMTFLDYGSTGLPEPSTSFQWYDDGVAISGATGYGYVLGATGELADATKTVIVTVPSGIPGGFFFDGDQKPNDYPMTRGVEYIFDQSDSSNNGHPLVLKNSGAAYDWTTDTNPGGGIGVRTLIVGPTAPDSLSYACGVHGSGMGGTIAVTTVPATDVTMIGNLTGVVSLSNNQGSTGATIDFGTMLNADITGLSLGNVVAGATLTATVTYGGTYDNIVWTGVTG